MQRAALRFPLFAADVLPVRRIFTKKRDTPTGRLSRHHYQVWSPARVGSMHRNCVIYVSVAVNLISSRLRSSLASSERVLALWQCPLWVVNGPLYPV